MHLCLAEFKMGESLYTSTFLSQRYRKIIVIVFFAVYIPGPHLKSKGLRAIFQKNGKKITINGKIFENLSKNVQNLKIF